jgi:hypothetical protein
VNHRFPGVLQLDLGDHADLGFVGVYVEGKCTHFTTEEILGRKNIYWKGEPSKKVMTAGRMDQVNTFQVDLELPKDKALDNELSDNLKLFTINNYESLSYTV